MAATARLRHGADLIYFEDGTAYQLGDDFTPPGSSLVPSFSSGTSANRYGGGDKIDQKAQNKEISFTVLCYASTSNEAGPSTLANRLVTMVSAAGDDTNPVMFEWTLTPDLPEPIWGQFGAWRRAEVVHASAQFGSQLGQYSRSEMVRVLVSLVVKPFALGTRQFPIAADTIKPGPVVIDYFGENSFTPTGVRMPRAGTNLCKNPIFGNRTAWSNDWSTTGVPTVTENIDPDYVFPGAERSAHILASTADGAIHVSFDSANTNTHWFSAYVKRPDSAAVTSADCEIYYGASLATTFRLLGNGVYLATASAAGTTSADSTGLSVKANKSIYFLAYQIEENANHQTWLACGDFPGYTWTGAAHASSSANTAPSGGYFFTPPDKINHYGGYSLAFVWKPDYSSDDAEADYLAFFGNDQGHSFIYNQTSDLFVFNGGGATTLSSSAYTFSPGDTMRFVIINDPAGASMYINGILADSDVGTWQTTAAITAFYVGNDASAGTTQPAGIIKAFELYDKVLTSAEALAIDAALASFGNADYIDPPMCTPNNGISQFPSATQPWKNYIFMDSIPGNLPPVLDMESFTFTGVESDLELKFTVLPSCGVSFAPTGMMYDCSSAAVAVSASADEVLATWPVYRLNELMGQTVYIATRLTDAGANLQLDFKLSMGGTSVRVGYANVVADGTMRMFYLGPLYIPSRASFPNRAIRNKNIVATATLYAQRTTGGASNVEVDYVDIMPPNLLRMIRTSAEAIATPILSYWDGQGAVFYNGTTPAEQVRLIGANKIEVFPMTRNLLHYQPGTNATANATERTFNGKFYLTPRWSL